jgi:sugar O-acyltransferase (sialic acid O-acetyltransferase NeuD family)
MKKKLLIFGTGKIAEVIYYYAAGECGYEVEAFCVNKEYVGPGKFQDKPVVPFEDIEKTYSPDRYEMFVAVGYHDLSRLREAKCREAMEKGFRLVSIVSPQAHLPTNVSHGWNCFIMPPAIIHPCVSLGNNVFVWSGAMIGHHTRIEDHCWLTSACHISGNVTLGANTFVAVNATVGHSVQVGPNCFLGANSLVTKNLEADKVVISESSKPIRLSSSQFLRMSSFSNL